MAFLLSGFPLAMAQENNSFLLQTLKTIDGCPVTHVYSSRLYVPARIEIHHDPTPDFLVHTNSTTSGSQINPEGSNNINYVLTVPNSTAQFSIQIFAKYQDKVEHPIIVEYWSQNQQMVVDQLSTLNSEFCRDIIIDTSQAPVMPDIGLTVQKITQSFLGQLATTTSQNSYTLYIFIIIVTAFLAIVIILLVLFFIRLSSLEGGNSAANEKMTSMIKNQNRNIHFFNDNTKLFAIELVNIVKRIAKIEERHLSFQTKFIDDFEVRFRSLFLDSIRIYNSKTEIEAKPEPQIKPTSTTPSKEEKPIIIPEQIPETPKEKPSIAEKIVEVVKAPFIQEKKVEKLIKSENEYYEIWSKEKEDSKLSDRYKEILKEYEKLINEGKNYEDARNEAYALHRIQMERLGEP